MGGVNHCSLQCRLAKFRGFYVQRVIRRCDWLKRTHNLEIDTGHIQKNAVSDQSQRRISPCTSNHGISPNDSVLSYSGWPLPVLHDSKVIGTMSWVWGEFCEGVSFWKFCEVRVCEILAVFTLKTCELAKFRNQFKHTNSKLETLNPKP